jgi:glucose/arabinose dehydrogenase
VIFVPFSGGKPKGPPKDILTGFLSDSGEAMGRPVGVVIAKSGTLLVADDVGNKVWRVAPGAQPVTATAKIEPYGVGHDQYE